MLSLRGRSVRMCDGLVRREWMRIGGLSAMGLGLSELAHARQLATGSTGNVASFGKAKACIVLFLLGGPPQHETWDPKPDAPSEVRGEFATIATATGGLRVGELMPLTAKLTNHIAVLRAMATDDNAHSSSGFWVLTGYPHSPKNKENSLPGPPNDRPCVAALVRKIKGDRSSLPGAVRLPEEIWNTGHIVWPGQDSGWLGPQGEPWLVTCDPNKHDFRVMDIALPVDISTQRLTQRNALREILNRRFAAPDSNNLNHWAAWQAKAADLLGSTSTNRAFAIDDEAATVRDRYGRNRFGQSVLLARRLVESGVSLVQVNWTRWDSDENVAPAWDTHAKNGERLKNALMPPMDQAYSALLEDLALRGLLDETLVVWVGEFGRTPRINARGGRDHWGHVFSAALAGGGIRGGVVHGASDRHGGYPLDGRVEPQDLTATIFHCLGISPDIELNDQLGRPYAITKGQPIAAIV